VAESYRTTYKALFGSLAAARARSWSERAQRLRRYASYTARRRRWTSGYIYSTLPPDVVLLPARRGIVVASAQEATVIKFAETPTKILELKQEAYGLKQATEAGLSAHVPAFVAAGATSTGHAWLAMELALNTHPVFERVLRSSRPFDTWPRLLKSTLLPTLRPLHVRDGTNIEHAGDWWHTCVTEVDLTELPEDLQWLARKVEGVVAKRPDSPVLFGTVHGDLHADHIRRSSTSWKLIDWGGCRHRPLIADCLTGFAVPDATEHQKTQYWRLYGAELAPADLPDAFEPYVNTYTWWAEQLAGLRLDVEDVEMHLLIDFMGDCLHFYREAGELSGLQQTRLGYMRQYSRADAFPERE